MRSRLFVISLVIALLSCLICHAEIRGNSHNSNVFYISQYSTLNGVELRLPPPPKYAFYYGGTDVECKSSGFSSYSDSDEVYCRSGIRYSCGYYMTDCEDGETYECVTNVRLLDKRK